MSTLKNHIDLLAISIIFAALPDDWDPTVAVHSAVSSYYELSSEYWHREYKVLKALREKQ
jgi:hypothetical protein